MKKVVFIYQRMLPYHRARFNAVSKLATTANCVFHAIEICSMDGSYGDIGNGTGLDRQPSDAVTTLFPDVEYQKLSPDLVVTAVINSLKALQPDVIFSPAPAFSEGAGAFHYKIQHQVKLILMDDAWELTDGRGWLTKFVKTLFYGYSDGVFLPAPLHGDYFSNLNIPYDRQRYAVDVVGDEFFDQDGNDISRDIDSLQPYVLFVGRLLSRKGVPTILRALSKIDNKSLNLVVIGDGPERDDLVGLSETLGIANRVRWMGRLDNFTARKWMSGSLALLVPSEFEQWGLVVNEAWLAKTVVLGSDTVGALRATVTKDFEWSSIPVGDVEAWCSSLCKLLKLSSDERQKLIANGDGLARSFSLASHVQSVAELINLPSRRRPFFLIGSLLRFWKGRVVIW